MKDPNVPERYDDDCEHGRGFRKLFEKKEDENDDDSAEEPEAPNQNKK